VFWPINQQLSTVPGFLTKASPFSTRKAIGSAAWHMPFNDLCGVFVAPIGTYENLEPIFIRCFFTGSSDMVRFDFGVFGKDVPRAWPIIIWRKD
jgi:hypothetical protein